MSPVENINAHVVSTLPKMSIDPIAFMVHQHHAVVTNASEWSDAHYSYVMSLDTICNTLN